jgi:hypothetical protein
MKGKDQRTTTSIALFQEKTVRRVWHNEQWYYSIIDVIAVLTDNNRPRKYWNDLKTKLAEEGYAEVSEKIGQLKMEASDGKMRETDVADTRTGKSVVSHTNFLDLPKKQEQIKANNDD